MNKVALLLGLILLVGGAATADEINFEQKIKEKCKGEAACEAKHRQRFEERVQRRQKNLNEKCKGDQKCEEEMKLKFEAKRAEKKALIDQKCGQDEACRKEEHKKIMKESKEKRTQKKEGKQGNIK